MSSGHHIILILGVLCLLATFAGLLSEWIGAPLLIVFIGLGMVAGEDGPGKTRFDNTTMPISSEALHWQRSFSKAACTRSTT